MAEIKGQIHIVKALVGHSSVPVTEGYTTANREARKDAAQKLGRHAANKPEEEKGEGMTRKNLDSYASNS
jgi:hypothetical protein